jgi:hypothetical protein
VFYRKKAKLILKHIIEKHSSSVLYWIKKSSSLEELSSDNEPINYKSDDDIDGVCDSYTEDNCADSKVKIVLNLFPANEHEFK